MVGKDQTSRIFQHCYLKCCKLQNLNPLPQVLPSEQGRILDFCADRIKYAEWGPILNALSSDLSLHTIAIRCRQPIKTVLENINCDKLAKNVTKRSVLLTRFMLTNLIEAVSVCISASTLLQTLIFEGLPLKEFYFSPIIQALETNNSLQHIALPRCSIGDEGCIAVCKVLKSMPNVFVIDMSYCDLTDRGVQCIVELLKYQKLQRYSENWIHTLRYRLPQLDTMAGLRRVSLSGNPGISDESIYILLEILSDDLWIKALDLQNCSLTEKTAQTAYKMLNTNNTITILDLRHNQEISHESLSRIRIKLKEREKSSSYSTQQYQWLPSSINGTESVRTLHKRSATVTINKEKVRPHTSKAQELEPKKKEKHYIDMLEEQLREEIAHRQQLEGLNLQLIEQMKTLKQQQIRLWNTEQNSSGSSGETNSARSCEANSAKSTPSVSNSSNAVSVDMSTLDYIQKAFDDIYGFIKTNQCDQECTQDDKPVAQPLSQERTLKKAQSMHHKLIVKGKRVSKTTKSASQIQSTNRKKTKESKLEVDMVEKTIGDTRKKNLEKISASKKRVKRKVSSSKVRSDSSSTLVSDDHD